jgi:hypothetical protein
MQNGKVNPQFAHEWACVESNKEEIMRHATIIITMLVFFMEVAAGCSISDKAADLRGIKGVDGDKLIHINTRRWAINLFMVKPIWGDASLNATVQAFADEAKKEGATKVRIVQSTEWVLWWFPPILAFIITPVYSDVAGDAILP